ncbi:14526_t:CDS:2 [Gigaspora margarita]|uniref:14526_t:CDS:1 n=1 Tax=Gigaspora margarita TaxID=4874 RepID=A0ABM8W694_GIGMA|nr:14526_t:CDS:2 [Gigaspora margarita]
MDRGLYEDEYTVKKATEFRRKGESHLQTQWQRSKWIPNKNNEIHPLRYRLKHIDKAGSEFVQIARTIHKR